MAFMSKVGNLLRQSVSKNINSDLCGSNPSIFQAIRSMSSSKVFVGGLSWNTDETSLRQAFSEHGEVIDARVIMDRESGRSRGFGFVTYTSTEEASKAISSLDGQNVDGRTVRVNYATERAPRTFGGGGYNNGGGYNSGGGYGYNSGGGGGYNSGGGGYNSGGGYGDGGNTYGGAGGGGGYGTESSGGGNFSVAGGVGGSESNFNDGVGGGESGDSSFASGGYTGNTGGSFDQTGPLEGSFKDDDGQPDDYANRQA
ncbi:hypothetical protein MKW98_017550 [Papaver atlanticum]|uniref:RRM domain-containing protein n=1 Tax=Papaver atlanticum TaxID=357466 RepID=A0AAD4TEN6_9MAGN|nr:hypothetical protein MKW98_017550 [Papaver atlanticum]